MDLSDCSRRGKPAGTRAFGPEDSWTAWTGLFLLVRSEEQITGDIKPGPLDDLSHHHQSYALHEYNYNYGSALLQSISRAKESR